jgi:protein-L-isoaspartate(D-aspartate) O-methyltransferase
VIVAPVELRPGVKVSTTILTPQIMSPKGNAFGGGPGARQLPDAALNDVSVPDAQQVHRSGLPAMTPADMAYADAHARMITNQIAGRGGFSSRVVDAMAQVPRHQFVLTEFAADSYEEKSLSIGFDRTIETPYLVAATAEQIHPQPTDRVLEVGTGSGYQTAVLAQLVNEVYTTEAHDVLARNAEVNFQRLGYTNNIFVRHTDVDQGWPEAAPFDAIVFNGSPDQISDQLKNQLKNGGRLIVPVDDANSLREYHKAGNQLILATSKNVRPAAPPQSSRADLSAQPKMELRTQKLIKNDENH